MPLNLRSGTLNLVIKSRGTSGVVLTPSLLAVMKVCRFAPKSMHCRGVQDRQIRPSSHMLESARGERNL